MADGSADPFPELGKVYRVKSNRQNKKGANDIKFNSKQNADSRQPQNQPGGSAPRPWFPQNFGSNAWGNPNAPHKLVNQGSDKSAGFNSSKVVDKSNSQKNMACGNGVSCEISDEETVESESEIVFDSDDELSLDGNDEDTLEISHERCKKSKWFRNFFDKLDRMTTEQINSQEMSLHCPACQGGVGAIDWYQGLQPLLIHSRTIQSRRARLHRVFADTLEEECNRKRIPLRAANEAYGKWEGLDKKVKDHEIVWPPMVVIMNTRHEQDENNKWYGMGNQELLDCFSNYAAQKARHSYGPQGHRGMSMLIFDASPAGYLEAVRLHKHFKEQGRDKEAWNLCQNPIVPGGKRQLYGYLASREDMDIFNWHCAGKSKLKFEMRSYQDTVESKIKHINDDSRLLGYFKDKIAKEQLKSKVLEESLSRMTGKLRITMEENLVMRERVKEHHQESTEEMDAQEIFFKQQLQIIEQAIVSKEDDYDVLQQARLEKGVEENIHSVEKVIGFLSVEESRMKQFGEVRINIAKIYHQKMMALRKKQFEEQLELVKDLENELTQLLDNASAISQEENSQK
ncbi:hypothetical protein HN51_030710 [Arachis hypogaea]|uniref:XS domain-containing protein n=1 Tax=Arachis hypogaea TaxID=3818 RepID=A0A445BA98_ARAHY|nr:protein SUPPRESSOR OF GENE SILENCING 3-like [Arachis hypogaea]QHO15244.1 Protein SUPPRESSOR OF GENE SILENCING [Arachis hypogaea]RYR35584.1 hypothetical protein Ahy_A10g050721 [Arachis hypogaea]